MKKWLIMFLSIVLAVSLSGCGNTGVPSTNRSNVKEESDREVVPENNKSDTKKDSKILIAYFSWSGNSKAEAELIQQKTDGFLFEIVREEPYPEDYTECTEVAKKEKEDNARPSIKNPLESVSEYEKIVVCYPIWWHSAPMCVGTFLEKYDLQGKTVYPVSQSASMDKDQYAESVEFIKNCAKGADVQEGLFVDADDEDAVTEYVENNLLK